jgi:predicted nucleic acid-binding protein
MKNGTLRVYADTSVFGGVFDPEFAKASERFFAQVRKGVFQLVVSSIVADELAAAPPQVRSLFDEILPQAEVTPITEEAAELSESYLQHNILAPAWREDAMHVALATVSRCDLIVSWNFGHIVHFDKIPRYNAVNILRGHRPIAIHSPSEVAFDEDETV